MVLGEQLLLDGMPVRLYPATPSRIRGYLDCPRRYRLAYLDRPAPPQGPPWAHNAVGSAVHAALAKWWELPLRRRTPEAGGDLVVRGWLTDGFRDREQCEAARERARAYVERYLTKVDAAVEPLGVEMTVSLTTSRASLWGRADRIDDRPGEGIVVVDYKTGRSVPDEDDARSSLALAVYAAAAARTFHRPCTRVELHHLPTGTVAAWDHTAETLEAQLARADVVAAELAELDDRYAEGLSLEEADELFPARVGSQCGWCDFRRSCDVGRSAVPRKEPWAGLATG